MIGSIASFGGFNLAQGATAYAAGPQEALTQPPFRDRRRRRRTQHSTAAAALAPGAMSALIAAQEHLAESATPPGIEALCARLDAAAGPSEAQTPAATPSLGALNLLA